MEALLLNTPVSGQLYFRPPLQNPVLLNSHTNSVFLHSHKRPAPVTDTFFTSQGCPLTKLPPYLKSFVVPRENKRVSRLLFLFFSLKVMPSFSTTHVHARVDCKTVGFFLKISKEISNAWRMRANRVSLTRPMGVWDEREKTDCPFSIQWDRSDQGVQKCRRAVRNLFTIPPSLWNWYTRWLISQENTACYCLHLASNLHAVIR